MSPGGKHTHFGTHNALLSLGPAEYLEVIAIDPDAPPPGRARWFGLDRWRGGPVLDRWVCRVPDLAAAITRLEQPLGSAVPLTRGDYRWRMAVREDGRLPMDNLHPALIEWQGPHPAPALPDQKVRLARMELRHPEAANLESSLGLSDQRLQFLPRETPTLTALFDTPEGQKWLL